ncbi:CBO0543 family protein [Caldanaerobius polysaccharolyticus]|uniref:CBO0543 family protein n=1 Tax=Caldanaerobius polysaccharolyticus TaxID=44256 RepID=UPI0012EC9102|nr:CBO0543 family protein [Caldanaerobius polysaccharolyticus]
MPYILLSLITVVLVILLVDKKRIKVFLPGYLLATEIGFALDVLFSVAAEYYKYTDHLLNNGWCILLMEVIIGPLIGVIYMNYLDKFRKWTYLYMAVWAGVLLGIEILFVLTGELTFYRWNFIYSVLVYMITLFLLRKVYTWYNTSG